MFPDSREFAPRAFGGPASMKRHPQADLILITSDHPDHMNPAYIAALS